MIRTLRAFFLSRLLREKFLLVGFALLIAVVWLWSFLGRAGQFLAEERHTTVSLAEQARWLANRDAVDRAAQEAARALKPEQTLDSTRLLAAVQSIANECGLQHSRTEPVEDANTPQFSVHALQFTINNVPNADYVLLRNFCISLQQRAPYIGIEQFTVVDNAGMLNATMKISSVEILH